MTERRRIDIAGLVQGVGFRPFVYRLASELGLDGWVVNYPGGVRLEIEGPATAIAIFRQQLRSARPPLARIDQLRQRSIRCLGTRGFAIRDSGRETSGNTLISPDLAPCADCLAELRDPGNRRYQYPFINCTQCGPRFSIIERLPYDRANTGMRGFELCEQCRDEYHDPGCRRFHAEAIACPDCGPELEGADADGRDKMHGQAALEQAVAALRTGKIVALKGMGGVQLLVDAGNATAVSRLRQRKQRPAKPFALLYPDLEAVLDDCQVSAAEQRLLCGPESPIVLLTRKDSPASRLADGISPGNPYLGVMLPASPLHYLLMELLQQPLVATSGNLAGEPLCIDNDETRNRLAGVADFFLLHNRPILRPLDDSVVRVMADQPVILRRARGYAPQPIDLPSGLPESGELLAVGGHLKNTVAVSSGNRVFLSQHLGDLDNRRSIAGFERALVELSRLYRLQPELVIQDQHPAYGSSLWAERSGHRRLAVQHHRAHFFSCMADAGYRGPALGVSWDGTGYSEDGIIRGGEFLCWDGEQNISHLASIRPFPLPGGEQAIREPRRQALGLLYAHYGAAGLRGDFHGNSDCTRTPILAKQFSPGELNNLLRMLDRQCNSPNCTSIGRLFDAVAALLGLVSRCSFEGEAAMALEFAAEASSTSAHYPFSLERPGTGAEFNWGAMISALLQDLEQGVGQAEIAAKFHNSLARKILAAARLAGRPAVFLSGGVFQNKRLSETAVSLLQENGYAVHLHRQMPANDGGLALGQIYYARTVASQRLASMHQTSKKQIEDKSLPRREREIPCA